MPKLWRAPIPMVRITAPQITAIQKLRCRGLAAASDEGTGMGRPNSLRILPARARRWKYRIATRPAAPRTSEQCRHADYTFRCERGRERDGVISMISFMTLGVSPGRLG